ncbi:MAG: SDR family NAD(P)-dependent oxidoreductase, partial [Thermaurantiacus sp.]
MKISRLFDVSDRTVVITGGSRGIGEMIARAYVENGARVILTSRKASDVEGLAAELGAAATAIPADLSQMAEIDRFVSEVARQTPRVDILFNNAGASWGAAFDDFPESGWDKVMSINLKAVFFLTQRMIGLLEAAVTDDWHARVINIGSIDGQHVSDLETYSYAASKAGVLHLTRMMAKFLAGRGVLVNAIAPGFFHSRMTAGIAEEFTDRMREETPMKRWGQPADMAG